MAISLLVGVALGAAHREARNGDRLAPTMIPLVLAMEESAGDIGQAYGRFRSSGIDPQNEFRKSAVGSAADPRRTAQAWYRGVPNYRGQIHGSRAKTTFSNLAHFPA